MNRGVISLICCLVPGILSAQKSTPDAYYRYDLTQTSPLYITTWLYEKDREPLPAGDNGTGRVFVDADTFRGESGVHWFSCRIDLSGTPSTSDILFLRITDLLTAYEVYWDSICIASNGTPGHDAESEIPGSINYEIRLPHELAGPGRHDLALRVSNFKGKMLFPKLGSFTTLLGYYISWHENFTRVYSYHHYFTFGACLFAMILSLSLFYSGGRNRPYLLFGMYCFFLSLIPLLSFVFIYYDITITHINLVDIISIAAVSLKDIFFIAFIVYTFDVGRKWFLILCTSAVLLALHLSRLPMSSIIQIQYIAVTILSLGLLSFSVWKKISGSAAALAGLLSPLLIMIASNAQREIYPLTLRIPLQPADIGFILFITGILFSISARIREQNRLTDALRIRSKHLEIELLKRHIKPHFLMNTLFTVISLIRKDANKAITMIELLADEFQIINNISQRTLIPLSEELDLCRKHLDIMQLRKHGAYTFITDHIDPVRQIPPMIFHTLIENAITHAYTAGEPGRIELNFQETERRVIYTMKNDGSRLAASDSPESGVFREGTGFKYIRSRLEESYPGRWTLDYGVADEKWVVTIAVTGEGT
ncbi:histidine kinase [bacterium]|nr:histidine kinase [bacterium]